MKEFYFESLVLKFSVLFFCLYYIFKLEGLCVGCLKSLRRFYDALRRGRNYESYFETEQTFYVD